VDTVTKDWRTCCTWGVLSRRYRRRGRTAETDAFDESSPCLALFYSFSRVPVSLVFFMFFRSLAVPAPGPTDQQCCRAQSILQSFAAGQSRPASPRSVVARFQLLGSRCTFPNSVPFSLPSKLLAVQLVYFGSSMAVMDAFYTLVCASVLKELQESTRRGHGI
jgi:hypothetical protein